MNEQMAMQLKNVQRYAALIGAAGIAVCALGYWWSPVRFFQAYLFAFLVVSGIGLGCMAIVMLHHLVGGRWGLATRRILEAGSWPLLFAPLLALPLIDGIDTLYPWADESVVQHDELLAKKVPYLNTEFFQQRAIGYLGVWSIIAGLLSWWSRSADDTIGSHRRQRVDRATNPGSGDRDYNAISNSHIAARGNWLRKLSVVGLVIYVLSATFAAIDWMMSLEPHWFSAIYGVIVIAGQCAAAFAVAIVTVSWLGNDPQLRVVATPSVRQDLGNLLLAAVTFWVYVTFSQFLIIWSGNLAEEIPWYLARSSSGWQWVALVVILLHFVVPFVALLSRNVKREPRYLVAVAIVVCIAHVVDVYWLVMPAMRGTLRIRWLDLTTLVTLGAVWKALSVWRLRTARLVPENTNAGEVDYGHLAAHQPG